MTAARLGCRSPHRRWPDAAGPRPCARPGDRCRDAGAAPQLQAERDEHGVVLGVQGLQGDVGADADLVADVHAQGADDVHVLVDAGVGQAVLGDAPAGHAPGPVEGLEDGDLMTLLGQIEGGGESPGAGADDGYPLAGGCGDWPHRGAALVEGHLVHDVTLEPANGDGIALVAGGTGGLALVGTDPSADAGEGVGVVEGSTSFIVAVADRGDVVGIAMWAGTGVMTAAGRSYSGRPLLARLFHRIAFHDLDQRHQVTRASGPNSWM